MVAFFYGPGSGADVMLPLRRTRSGSSFVAAEKNDYSRLAFLQN